MRGTEGGTLDDDGPGLLRDPDEVLSTDREAAGDPGDLGVEPGVRVVDPPVDGGDLAVHVALVRHLPVGCGLSRIEAPRRVAADEAVCGSAIGGRVQEGLVRRRHEAVSGGRSQLRARQFPPAGPRAPRVVGVANPPAHARRYAAAPGGPLLDNASGRVVRDEEHTGSRRPRRIVEGGVADVRTADLAVNALRRNRVQVLSIERDRRLEAVSDQAVRVVLRHRVRGRRRRVREGQLAESGTTVRVTQDDPVGRRRRRRIVQLLLVSGGHQTRRRSRCLRLVRVSGVVDLVQADVSLREDDVAGLRVHRLNIGGRRQLHPVLQRRRRELGQHERLPLVSADSHAPRHRREVQHGRLRVDDVGLIRDLRQSRGGDLARDLLVADLPPGGREVGAALLDEDLTLRAALRDADAIPARDVTDAMPVSGHAQDSPSLHSKMSPVAGFTMYAFRRGAPSVSSDSLYPPPKFR